MYRGGKIMRFLTRWALTVSVAFVALMLAPDRNRMNLSAQSETQRSPELLTVLYRWEAKPGSEVMFREGWRAMTESIYRTRRSLGSRLHRAKDGTWLGYAQWPSEEIWRKSQESGSANAAAGQKMSQVATLLSTERLRAVEDLSQSPASGDEPILGRPDGADSGSVGSRLDHLHSH